MCQRRYLRSVQFWLYPVYLCLPQGPEVGEHEGVVDGGRRDEDVLRDGGVFVLSEQRLDQVHGEGPLTAIHNSLRGEGPGVGAGTGAGAKAGTGTDEEAGAGVGAGA